MSDIEPYQKFAEIYDEYINAGRPNFYKKYYSFIQKVLNKLNFEPDKILDMACGTGELTKIFQNNGYNIRGIDISEHMLKVAKKKGLKVQKKDMSDFNLDESFDLIVCIYDSLNYLTDKKDLKGCFESVNKNLTSDGVFIFDMNSDYFINHVIPQKCSDYNKMDDVEVFTINSYKPNRWILREIMFENMEDNKYKRYEEEHIERAYSMNEIKKFLDNAGLDLVDTFGSLDFGAVKEDAERWFFVCKK